MPTAGRMRMVQSNSEASVVVTAHSNTVTVVSLLREELEPHGKLTQSSHTNMLQWE